MPTNNTRSSPLIQTSHKTPTTYLVIGQHPLDLSVLEATEFYDGGGDWFGGIVGVVDVVKAVHAVLGFYFPRALVTLVLNILIFLKFVIITIYW